MDLLHGCLHTLAQRRERRALDRHRRRAQLDVEGAHLRRDRRRVGLAHQLLGDRAGAAVLVDQAQFQLRTQRAWRDSEVRTLKNLIERTQVFVESIFEASVVRFGEVLCLNF